VRIEKIWTHEHEAAFLESAPAYLHLPLLLGLWTAQREGDLLALSWASYDGTHIRLKQSKTGARMVIPVGVPLKAGSLRPRNRAPTLSCSTVAGSHGPRTPSRQHLAPRPEKRELSDSRFMISEGARSRVWRWPDAVSLR
jgi:integrase